MVTTRLLSLLSYQSTFTGILLQFSSALLWCRSYFCCFPSEATEIPRRLRHLTQTTPGTHGKMRTGAQAFTTTHHVVHEERSPSLFLSSGPHHQAESLI